MHLKSASDDDGIGVCWTSCVTGKHSTGTATAKTRAAQHVLKANITIKSMDALFLQVVEAVRLYSWQRCAMLKENPTWNPGLCPAHAVAPVLCYQCLASTNSNLISCAAALTEHVYMHGYIP